MSTEIWTNEFLNQMRLQGDPPADAVIAALFKDKQIDAANAVLRTLVMNDGIPREQLPPELRSYLDATSQVPPFDPAKVARGEELFALYGPEILLVLGFYSLPAAYSARKGAQVLYRTGRMLFGPVRRVFATAQMVIDVMAAGGLGPGGKGIRAIQKVRLMHAAIRYMLQNDPRTPWDASLGVPINQEDLAGTLMTFTTVIFDGLNRLGIPLSEADQDAFLHTWLVVGRMMGLREEMLPATSADALVLTRTIFGRQAAPSPEGTELTAALLTAMVNLLDVDALKRLPSSSAHFFLSHVSFSELDLAQMLNIAPGNWTESLIHWSGALGEFIGKLGLESHLMGRAIRAFSLELLQKMVQLELHGQRVPFSIPDHLRTHWGVR